MRWEAMLETGVSDVSHKCVGSSTVEAEIAGEDTRVRPEASEPQKSCTRLSPSWSPGANEAAQRQRYSPSRCLKALPMEFDAVRTAINGPINGLRLSTGLQSPVTKQCSWHRNQDVLGML